MFVIYSILVFFLYRLLLIASMKVRPLQNRINISNNILLIIYILSLSKILAFGFRSLILLNKIYKYYNNRLLF